jgi:hypothetical protein
MLAVIDPITLACAASFVFSSTYLIALWVYGAMRTRSFAFFVLMAAALMGLAVSIANVALVYDSHIGIRLLGHDGWRIFYYAFVCIQPIQSWLSIVGLTALVLRTTRKGLTNRSSQPRPGDELGK